MNVIFFDGLCGLCNGFVDFIMKIDRKGSFKFSPLQSEYARTHLPPEYTQDLSTVIVQIDGMNYRKSQAVLKVFKELGGVWSILSLARILPEGFSNSIYDLIARNRYRLFGQKETCRLPTPEERQRFIL